MSGFKTPTAMSPPKKQNRSPQIHRPMGTMHPYDATPTLLQAFEQLKTKEADAKVSARASNATLPSFSTVEEGRIATRARSGADRASSATYPPGLAIREANVSSRCGPLLYYNGAATCSPLSANSPNSVIRHHRPRTAPLPVNQHLRSAGHSGNGTTVMNSSLSLYHRMSGTVGSDSASDKPLLFSTPCPDLEVYKRHESNWRLMVCEAREQHCSMSVEEFMGEQTGLRGIEELKAELLDILGFLSGGNKERARADLKVATGNMLERIVAWDLNKSEALEQPDIPLLSTVPTTESMNKVDAIYILKMFRLGMKKIPGDDIRSKVGMLPDEDLMALLHFTLLVSRPVLVWELDLDEI